MPQIDTLLIEPLDVLVLRGNKLFADAGSHGEALMPPWPSVAAGALRSRMLADAEVDLSAFADGRATLAEPLATILGSAVQPGSFRIAHFGLAHNIGNNDKPVFEALLPLPADISIDQNDKATPLQATALHPSLSTSHPLPLSPILRQTEAGKPKGGIWLTAAGITAWQRGEPLNKETHWLSSGQLWQLDPRLGIALEAGKATAAEGQLYTSEAIALKPGVAFVVRVQGAHGTLPQKGLLRLGGDGHAARIVAAECTLPAVDTAALARRGRFRLLLTSPGIFPQGWKLPGLDGSGSHERWHFHGASARLVCAAVPRLETISGWDVAKRRPKPALRTAPTGSVYWLDDFQGDPAALEALQRDGLPHIDDTRRAEGFNACLLAHWN